MAKELHYGEDARRKLQAGNRKSFWKKKWKSTENCGIQATAKNILKQQ